MTGCDLVEIERVYKAYSKRPQRFLERIFTKREREELMVRANPLPGMAARLAGKEAVAKALGCGIGQVAWTDVEILGRPPVVTLSGRASALAAELGVKQVSISLSHSRETAVAVCVVSAGC